MSEKLLNLKQQTLAHSRSHHLVSYNIPSTCKIGSKKDDNKHSLTLDLIIWCPIIYHQHVKLAHMTTTCKIDSKKDGKCFFNKMNCLWCVYNDNLIFFSHIPWNCLSMKLPVMFYICLLTCDFYDTKNVWNEVN